MDNYSYSIKSEGDFKYIEEGNGDVLLLLHGLFGALSNFKSIITHFRKNYKVVVPLLPLYELPILELGVKGLSKYVTDFVKFKGYHSVIPLGNSLGGHVAQLFALENPEHTRALILTGSSGLFEDSFGGSFPKRGSYEFIRKKTEYTFYDPKTASKDLVDEVFDICNDRGKALRVITLARSAIRTNLSNVLHKIHAPTLLIWGREDKITPPFVADEFHKLIQNSELKFIGHCGHAPMMEKPEEFNILLQEFLDKIKVAA